MFRNMLSKLTVAVLAGIGMFALATEARADFALRYSVNGGGFTTVNNGTNFINVTIGSLTIGATGSATGPTPGLTTMDLGVSGQHTGALTLLVQISLNGINTAPALQNLIYAFTGSLGGSAGAGSSLAFQAWANNTATLFDTATNTVANTGSLPPGSSGSIPFNGVVPYTATLQILITLTGGVGSISSDNNVSITPAPAPAALVLFATAVPGLAFGWVRSRRKK